MTFTSHLMHAYCDFDAHVKKSRKQMDRRAACVGTNWHAASRAWLDIRFQNGQNMMCRSLGPCKPVTNCEIRRLLCLMFVEQLLG